MDKKMENELFGDRRRVSFVYSQPPGTNKAEQILTQVMGKIDKTEGNVADLDQGIQIQIAGGMYPILIKTYSLIFERDVKREEVMEYLESGGFEPEFRFQVNYTCINPFEKRPAPFEEGLIVALLQRLGERPFRIQDDLKPVVIFECKAGEEWVTLTIGADPIPPTLVPQ